MTLNLQGPGTTPGASPITAPVLNAAVNLELATKADVSALAAKADVVAIPPTARAPTPDDDVTKGYRASGSLASLTFGTFGSGYTVATVALTAPPAGGVQATATATVFGGQVTGYTITNPGSGYAAVPLATVSGDGAGATATGALSPGSLWLSPDKTVWQCLRATAGDALWYPLRVGNVLPGDVGPAVLGMYGTRRLVSAYVTNKLFDLTRASDSAVKTIGFSGDIADAATADAFCVNTVCTISTLYDQSGAGGDLVQTDPTLAMTWGTRTIAGLRAISSISQQDATPALTVAVAAGGSGYIAGDVGKTVVIQGGAPNATTTVTIATVSTGAVTAITLNAAGSYATGGTPANPAATAGGGTTGTGLTVTIKWPFVSISGTVASYVPKNSTVFWVGAPRSSLQSNGVVNMGVASDWNLATSMSQLGMGMVANATRSSLVTEASDALSVWVANNAVMSVYNGNNQAAFTSAVAGPASTTTLTLGNNETPEVHGPAVSDTVAWMVWSAVPSAAQLLNMRAATMATFGLIPQANDVWVAQGDSITVGHKATDLRGYPRQAIPLLSEVVRQYNIGITGTTLVFKMGAAVFNSEMVRIYDPLARRFVVSIDLGTNDITANVSGPTLFADLQAYVASVKALGSNVRVIVSTLLPRSGLSGPQQTALTAYNVSIQTLWNVAQSDGGLGVDGLADFAADPTMGASTAPANTALYVDTLHPTTLGYGYMAAIMAKQVNYQLAH